MEDAEIDEVILFDLPAKTIDTFWEVEKEVIHSKKKRDALVSNRSIPLFVLLYSDRNEWDLT